MWYPAAAAAAGGDSVDCSQTSLPRTPVSTSLPPCLAQPLACRAARTSVSLRPWRCCASAGWPTPACTARTALSRPSRCPHSTPRACSCWQQGGGQAPFFSGSTCVHAFCQPGQLLEFRVCLYVCAFLGGKGVRRAGMLCQASNCPPKLLTSMSADSHVPPAAACVCPAAT
jgi:hypothetical protein